MGSSIGKAALALLVLLEAGCCTTLSQSSAMTPSTEPAVVIRSAPGGEFIGPTPRWRPRKFEYWEIRIWPDGTVQEARGWKGAAGVLPSRISVADATVIIRDAQRMADLEEFLGRLSTDVPFREIELTVDGKRRVIHAYPTEFPEEVESFDRVWRAIADRFPERKVCR